MKTNEQLDYLMFRTLNNLDDDTAIRTWGYIKLKPKFSESLDVVANLMRNNKISINYYFDGDGGFCNVGSLVFEHFEHEGEARAVCILYLRLNGVELDDEC